MKVIVHLKNEVEIFDDNVKVEIELPCRPIKGDMIYLKAEKIIELEEQIKNYPSKHRRYIDWYNPDKEIEVFPVHVVETLFSQDKNGEYVLHIELEDTFRYYESHNE